MKNASFLIASAFIFSAFAYFAFADVIQKGIAKGMKYEWRIIVPEAHISDDLAWVTYTNRGSFDTDKDKQQRVWLESAVLERNDKTWRIRFLHSTLASKGPIATKK